MTDLLLFVQLLLFSLEWFLFRTKWTDWPEKRYTDGKNETCYLGVLPTSSYLWQMFLCGSTYRWTLIILMKATVGHHYHCN